MTNLIPLSETGLETKPRCCRCRIRNDERPAFCRVPLRENQEKDINRLAGGVVTFGIAPPRVPPYEGPTARKRIKSEQAAVVAAGLGSARKCPSRTVLSPVGRASR